MIGINVHQLKVIATKKRKNKVIEAKQVSMGVDFYLVLC